MMFFFWRSNLFWRAFPNYFGGLNLLIPVAVGGQIWLSNKNVPKGVSMGQGVVRQHHGQ
jgi:hypothetical protein